MPASYSARNGALYYTPVASITVAVKPRPPAPSQQSLWRASRRLGNEMPREAGVLRGFAEEESAKPLILIDAVRCPKHRAPSRLGAIMGGFYSHLARLIYAESVLFPPNQC